MIFAAGRGSRLRPLTDTLPKCLVEIGGKPMLEHVVERLKAVGVTSVVINVSYLKEQVVNLIKEKDNFGIEVIISEEEELLETGGGLKKAAGHFEDVPEFFVYNADIFSTVGLDELLTYHQKHRPLATLATFEYEKEPRCLLFDSEQSLCGWRNRKSGDEKIVKQAKSYLELGFMGIHVVSNVMLQKIVEVPEEKFSIISPYLHAIETGEQIRACVYESPEWHDIGTLEQLEEVRKRHS